jgi:Type III flagellar switch regulator (C-ring) FliN C-term
VKQALARPAIDTESVVARLPVELEVGVPVHDFRVRNLLALEPGVLVASHWSHGEDLPLAANDVQLAWTEFEVVVNSLAARITRIA